MVAGLWLASGNAAGQVATRPATRPAATQPAGQGVKVELRGALPAARPARISDKARRQAQRQSIAALPDGGTFKLHELIRFTVVDGRIRSEILAGFTPGTSSRRVRIEGSDALWMVNAFSNGQSAHHTIIRYDFDAPDTEFWMVSYTFQERSYSASVFAQAGDASEVSRVYYNQYPTGVTVNLSGWDGANRIRQLLAVNATDLFQLRNEYPEAVRKFLLPAFSKLTREPILRPGASDVYRVFTRIPADSNVLGRLHALLPPLAAEAEDVRERATRELMGLGRAGALAALRFDPDLLAPEQSSRLGALIMAHSRMTIDDVSRAATDVHFLIDCLEDEDPAVRAAAAAALEGRLSRKIGFDPDAGAKERGVFADGLRARVAKEQGKDRLPDVKRSPEPVINIRG